MQNVEFVVFNAKYNVVNMRYYFIDLGIFDVPSGCFYIHRGFISYGSFRKPILEPVKTFDDAVSRVINIYRLRSVDSEKILKSEYYKLKSVYNSLRYFRIQLKYRRIDDRELWLLSKKLVSMINGFIYVEKNGLDVPDGLKRFYYVFRKDGVGIMLEEVKTWLGIGEDDWMRVVRKLIFVYSIRSPFLEFRYGLRKISKNVVIKGINDWKYKSNLSKYWR